MNGIKASAMLEECGLRYEAHPISFASKDQRTPEFLSLNPNNKVPAIIDPQGPGDVPLALWESGAILIYLAEKTKRFLPSDPAMRFETLQWLMWQTGGVGPMFAQFGFFFKNAGQDWGDRRPMERYRDETRRLLGVLEQRLDGRRYIMGDEYSIADIAVWPSVRTLDAVYEGSEELGLDNFTRVNAWLGLCTERPASKIAINTPPRV